MRRRQAWAAAATVASVAGGFMRLATPAQIELLVPRRAFGRFVIDAETIVRRAMRRVDEACGVHSTTAFYGGAAVYALSGGGPSTTDVDFFTCFLEREVNVSCIHHEFRTEADAPLLAHPFPSLVGWLVRMLRAGNGTFTVSTHVGIDSENEYFRVRVDTVLHSGKRLHVLESMFNTYYPNHIKQAVLPSGVRIFHPQSLFFHALNLAATEREKNAKRLAQARAVARALDERPWFDRANLATYGEFELHKLFENKTTTFTQHYIALVRAGLSRGQARRVLLRRVAAEMSRA
jgi:hypothetical protein